MMASTTPISMRPTWTTITGPASPASRRKSERSGRNRLARELDEASRQLGSLAFVLVLEEHERLLPALRPHPRAPVAKLVVGVVLSPQSQVAPARGRYQGRRRALVALGQTTAGAV